MKSETRLLACGLIFLLAPAVALATVAKKAHTVKKSSHRVHTTRRKYMPRFSTVRRRLPLRRASSRRRTLASSKSRRTRRSGHTRAASNRWRMPASEIPASRAGQIQQALIQAGDLHGQPTGQWDAQTREAMKLYQRQNGFDATGLPDAKSLMKMGLGPHPLPLQADPLARAAQSQLTRPSEHSHSSQQADAGLEGSEPGNNANATDATRQPFPPQ
ncbi:MAG: peptidoglycan-binding domain-containing protein [Terriglobia bacterium]